MGFPDDPTQGIEGSRPRRWGSSLSRGFRKVYLPMALPTILAGIKTSAVINVGTATLAALIGAGGLGEPIVSGLSINNNSDHSGGGGSCGGVGDLGSVSV